MDFHFVIHVIELLLIIYLLIAVKQTREMLSYLSQTIISVDDNLDKLINLSEHEVRHSAKALEKEQNSLEPTYKPLDRFEDM